MTIQLVLGYQQMLNLEKDTQYKIFIQRPPNNIGSFEVYLDCNFQDFTNHPHKDLERAGEYLYKAGEYALIYGDFYYGESHFISREAHFVGSWLNPNFTREQYTINRIIAEQTIPSVVSEIINIQLKPNKDISQALTNQPLHEAAIQRVGTTHISNFTEILPIRTGTVNLASNGLVMVADKFPAGQEGSIDYLERTIQTPTLITQTRLCEAYLLNESNELKRCPTHIAIYSKLRLSIYTESLFDNAA